MRPQLCCNPVQGIGHIISRCFNVSCEIHYHHGERAKTGGMAFIGVYVVAYDQKHRNHHASHHSACPSLFYIMSIIEIILVKLPSKIHCLIVWRYEKGCWFFYIFTLFNMNIFLNWLGWIWLSFRFSRCKLFLHSHFKS